MCVHVQMFGFKLFKERHLEGCEDVLDRWIFSDLGSYAEVVVWLKIMQELDVFQAELLRPINPHS